MTSADICTCRFAQTVWSNVSCGHRTKKQTYTGTRGHEWEGGGGGGRSLVTLQNRPITGPQQQQQQLQTWKKEKMRYWWSGHAARLVKLLPSYLIPVWACVCSCLDLHTCTKKTGFLELFRASQLVMQVVAAVPWEGWNFLLGPCWLPVACCLVDRSVQRQFQIKYHSS